MNITTLGSVTISSWALVLLRESLALLFCIAALVFIWRQLLPAIVRWRYRRAIPEHRFVQWNDTKGAASDELVYLTTTYDCRQSDVIVSGQATNCLYWCLGVFDGHARGLEGGHLNARTIDQDEQKRWRVRLTVTPRDGEDCLDCSASPRGLLILRVLLPAGDVRIPAIRLEDRLP